MASTHDSAAAEALTPDCAPADHRAAQTHATLAHALARALAAAVLNLADRL